MTQQYAKLKALLQELFQLDQPDLDFGLYRIMHAESAEVSQFLDKDLLPQVKAAFGAYKTADKAELEKELAKAVEQAQGLGVDPEATQKVKDLRAKLASEAVDLGQLEGEVYDHLFSFFRRYYSEGDYLAKRVYKPGVYAIPYEGEEVALHWANKDQYYIKTSEYLRDYAFRLRPDDPSTGSGQAQNPMRVHFRLVDAAEGEHGNVKAAEGKDRVFILAAGGETGRDPSTGPGQSFIAEADGEQGKELCIRFEYRPATLTDWPEDVSEGKTKPPAQKDLSADAAKRILAVADASLAPWITELGKPHVLASGEKTDYTRLEAHLRRYTARNTFDYFIHKDLGGFLRRELDFYLKNEVMHLDDVENESAPRVEQYLSKIKVIRRIAGKIIAFLAQLEDFQKKLWLKKKFVVETSYCIRLGCIPESFYAEIAANDAQREEWVRLCALDELQATDGDLVEPGKSGYSVPLTLEFLKAHPTLMVDTRHFGAGIAARLLEAVGDVDAQGDGVLFHSENFQALALMHARYRGQVKCIYIDPNYNTEKDDFLYKDGYKRSTWIAMMEARLDLARRLLADHALFYCSIDENETARLRELGEAVFGGDNFIADLIWNTQHSQQSGLFTPYHEYVQVFGTHPSSTYENFSGGSGEIIAGAMKKISRANPASDFEFPAGTPWAADVGTELSGVWGDTETVELVRGRMICEEGKLKHPVVLRAGWTQKRQMEKFFADERPVLDSKGQEVTGFFFTSTGKLKIIKKRSRITPKSLLPEFGTTAQATSSLADAFGHTIFGRPKPVAMIQYLVSLNSGEGSDETIVDFFAGSGTTGHAVINLNREDGGRRKFILVEMGDYFDTVLLPRIKKVTYTPEWKDGKPKRLATPEEAERSPRIMKVVRLESYEDALNNLETRRTEKQQLLLDAAEAQGADRLKEQYLLRYMLDVETRGSPSLLNMQGFTDPTAYKLKVKRPGSDESREVNVDLLETFNWLIGLTVRHVAAPQTFSAAFERDTEKRLRLKGRLKQEDSGPFWFRTVTGTTPDGRKALIIWRKLTGDPEQDNLVLDEWFTRQGYSAKDSEFDLIYVNGGNNLENLKTPDDRWKVRLIEEDFHRLMFEGTE